MLNKCLFVVINTIYNFLNAFGENTEIKSPESNLS